MVGTATYQGKTYTLRDYPYRVEEGVILPLEDGTDLLLLGIFYPTGIDFGDLDTGPCESVTLVGNNGKWRATSDAAEEVQEGR